MKLATMGICLGMFVLLTSAARPRGNTLYLPIVTNAWTPPPLIVIVSIDPIAECVVILNAERVAVDLTGWSINDSVCPGWFCLSQYVFPAYILAPGAEVRLWTAEGMDTATDLYWGTLLPVWEDGYFEEAFLWDAKGHLVSRYSYVGR